MIHSLIIWHVLMECVICGFTQQQSSYFVMHNVQLVGFALVRHWCAIIHDTVCEQVKKNEATDFCTRTQNTTCIKISDSAKDIPALHSTLYKLVGLGLFNAKH